MPAALSRNNDILECNFLDRKVNKIIVLVAATLVLISIVLVGLLNNNLFDNSKGLISPFFNTVDYIFNAHSLMKRGVNYKLCVNKMGR